MTPCNVRMPQLGNQQSRRFGGFKVFLHQRRYSHRSLLRQAPG